MNDIGLVDRVTLYRENHSKWGSTAQIHTRPLGNPPVLTYVRPEIQSFDSRALEYDVTLCSCRRFEGVCCLLSWVLGREDLSTTPFRNVRKYVSKDKASHSWRRRSQQHCHLCPSHCQQCIPPTGSDGTMQSSNKFLMFMWLYYDAASAAGLHRWNKMIISNHKKAWIWEESAVGSCPLSALLWCSAARSERSHWETTREETLW